MAGPVLTNRPTFNTGSPAPTAGPPAAPPSFGNQTAVFGSAFGLSDVEAGQTVNVRSQQRPAGTDNYMGPVKTQAVAKPLTFEQVMQSYAQALKAQPNDFIQTQAKLFAGGFYDKYLAKGQAPKFGRMDSDTIKALQDAGREAIATPGATIDDIIEGAAASGGAASGQGAKPTRLTNPDVVKANAQAAAQSVIGKRLDDSSVAKIQQSAEDLAQKSYTDSNGQIAYYGGTPDQNWLQDQIRQMLPQTTQAYSTANNIGGLLKLLDTQGQFSAYHS